MKIFLPLLLSFSFYSGLFAQGNMPEDLIKEGVQLHDEGQYNQAIKKYQKAIKLDEKNPTAYYEIAYTYLVLKEYKKCIKNADKVLKLNKGNQKSAYILKGTAYDNMGKPKKAITTYEDGIKIYPDDYLLHYNLGVTAYKIQMPEKAKEAFQDAIQYNDNHGSSHLLLANIQKDEGNRIQALLGYYFFLLVEPDTERAKAAYAAIEYLTQKDVSKGKDNNITVELNINALDKGEFSMAELMVSMKEASIIGEMQDSGKVVEDFDLFLIRTQNLFSTLSTMQEDKKGFYWEYYVSFFSDLEEQKQTETFCHYVSLSQGITHEEWFKENETQLDSFTNWLNGSNN